MSDSTTRIVDLPENITTQIMPNFSENVGKKQKMEYDQNSTTYVPINNHPNPYGNDVQPSIQNFQAPKYEPDTNDFANMPQMRLPSRDIPRNQLQFTNDEEIIPNYIPKPKLTSDYVREYEEASEKNISKHESSKRHVQEVDDILTEYQLAILISVLFFLFQIPLVNTLLFKYLSFMLIFSLDGNLNTYGILLKSCLFGVAFVFLQKMTKTLSNV